MWYLLLFVGQLLAGDPADRIDRLLTVIKENETHQVKLSEMEDLEIEFMRFYRRLPLTVRMRMKPVLSASYYLLIQTTEVLRGLPIVLIPEASGRLTRVLSAQFDAPEATTILQIGQRILDLSVSVLPQNVQGDFKDENA